MQWDPVPDKQNRNKSKQRMSVFTSKHVPQEHVIPQYLRVLFIYSFYININTYTHGGGRDQSCFTLTFNIMLSRRYRITAPLASITKPSVKHNVCLMHWWYRHTTSATAPPDLLPLLRGNKTQISKAGSFRPSVKMAHGQGESESVLSGVVREPDQVYLNE